MKRLNYITLIISFWLLLSGFESYSQSRVPHLNRTELEKVISDYVQKNNIPALSVGLVFQGELVGITNRGVHKRGDDMLVTEESVYQIGSLSKTFTSLIFMNLQNEGVISIDQPITEFLKDDLNEKSLENLKGITMGQVLNHTAGFPNNGPSVPPTPFGAPMIGGYKEADFIKDLGNMQIKEDLKGKWSYSNFGFGLIGHILEKASGKSYEELLQEYVLKPNNMEQSTSDLMAAVEKGTVVTPYHVHKRKKETKPWEMGKVIPAGGIFSSVTDLSKLMINQMIAYDRYKEKGTNNSLVLTQQTVAINDVMEYGNGFFKTINSLDTSIIQYGHGGDLDGFASMYEFYPQYDLGLVMLTSSGGTWLNELKGELEAKFFDLNIRKEIDLPKKVLKRYTGKYEFESGQTLILFVAKENLMASFKNTDPIPLYPESETKFFFRSMNSQVEFEMDGNEVSKLTYIQNGQKVIPKRIK